MNQTYIASRRLPVGVVIVNALNATVLMNTLNAPFVGDHLMELYHSDNECPVLVRATSCPPVGSKCVGTYLITIPKDCVDFVPEYCYACDCVDAMDTIEVQNITCWHSNKYSSNFGHPPSLKITKKKFKELTGVKGHHWCGYNKDVVFTYNADDDVHYFYTKSGYPPFKI